MAKEVQAVGAKVAPYGSWKSPITADLIVAETATLGQVKLDGEDIYWVEARPREGGRNVVVRQSANGQTTNVTPPGLNARTRVHEYGGGAYAVSSSVVYFSNFADQRLYRQDPGAEPRPITPEGDLRYADGVIDRRRNRMLCVREDHSVSGREAVNSLVGLDLSGREPARVLVSGNDFYSSPCLSPDGARLAWLTWNHPNMPWDGTELWMAELADDGGIRSPRKIAGGPEESIFQPAWSPNGTLYFLSDRSGWWNLYRWRHESIEPVLEMEADFGRPQWVFGMSTYAFESDGRIMCTITEKGIDRLVSIDTNTGKLEGIQTPYSQFLASVVARPGMVAFIAGSPTEPQSIVSLDLPSRRLDVIRRSITVSVDPGYLSVPQAIEFPTEGGRTAHAFYYPPRNRDYAAPRGERPPLIVHSHGGPTSAASISLNLQLQYFTSRGFAGLDVNYGGSSGYGRAYRERLNGQWGVVDVDDCVNAARYLVERGQVDGNRLAIAGGSAGGYTTLCALTFHDTFKAGASYFGLSELEVFVKDTHKFESRYLEWLIGPYPERRDLYRARSPIYFTDRLSCPVILFQGLEDKVVPPSQAELMVEALRQKGLPVAYVAFEGEQHGFRRAETIKRTLEGELYFYSRVFGFELPDRVEPVTIENL